VLLKEMASLRLIDRSTLAATVREFAAELDSIGLHVPSDPSRLMEIFQNQLSLETMELLSSDLGGAGADMGKSAWGRIGELEIEELLPLLAGESATVCAVLLSKLPPGRAAEVLAKLPDERADAVVKAFDATASIGPVAVSRIGLALGLRSDATVESAFVDEPVKRLAAVLTSARSSFRNAVLSRIELADPNRAAAVRAAVFSFENVPDRVDPRDLSKVLRGLDNSQIVALLGGAPNTAQAAVTFLFDNISSRLADQLREEIAERGTIPLDEAEAAMSAFVTEVLNLVTSGEIKLTVAGEG
jgi:flagellar motor switch protein FliG